MSAQIVEFDDALLINAKTSFSQPNGRFLNVAGVEATNTTMQAAAQVVRVDIGENKWILPLFFYVGAAGSAFGADGPRAAIANILNPLAGNFNLRSVRSWKLKKLGKQTLFRLTYDLGGKQFTAADSTGAGKPIFVASAQGGFRAETKALLNKEELGIAYFQATGGGFTTGGGGSLDRLFGPGTRKSVGSFTIDAGITIGQSLLAKFSLYQAFHPGTNRRLEKAIYKFGFDYHPKKTP